MTSSCSPVGTCSFFATTRLQQDVVVLHKTILFFCFLLNLFFFFYLIFLPIKELGSTI